MLAYRPPLAHRAAAGLALILLVAGPTLAAEVGGGAQPVPQTEPRPSPGPPGSTPGPVPGPAPQSPAEAGLDDAEAQWLDEVRAQRKAWEERRQSVRDAADARRQLSDPWGLARQRAWEQEVKRRRAARQQRMEEQRQLFRGLGPAEPPWQDLGGGELPPFSDIPGGAPPLPAPESPPVAGAPAQQPSGLVYPPPAPPAPAYAPRDWDNLWYYRGY